MAFCNSCGATLNPGTRFCNNCGAPIVSSSPVSPVTSPPAVPGQPVTTVTFPPAASGGGALKAILIVVSVVVLIGTLAVVSLGFFAWRVARHARVRQDHDNVTVETPFGTVESTKDPQDAARNLGVHIYPGGVLKDGAASATFGAVHTTTLNLETTDSVDQVCSFYKSRYPTAMAVTSQTDECTIVSNDKKNMINITIKAEGDKTKIVINSVTHKPGSSSSN